MKGDPQLSPWISPKFADYLGRYIQITLNFNFTTRALTGGSIHRDVGCLWTHIVWDVPSSGGAKRSPNVPTGDTPFTPAQIASFWGSTPTIDQVMALQITAEP